MWNFKEDSLVNFSHFPKKYILRQLKRLCLQKFYGVLASIEDLSFGCPSCDQDFEIFL